MQRFLILALVALVPLVVVAQDRQHQQSAAGVEHPYEILSADGWVLRVDRYTGATAILSTQGPRREMAWQTISHPDLPGATSDAVRYQLLRADRSSTQRWFLLDQRTGRAWLLITEVNAMRDSSHRWSPIGEASER